MAGRQPQLTTRETSRNLDRARANTLEVATDHFVRNGFHGTRVNEMANGTATTKWMAYYCFGSKAGLFSVCLRAEYARIRAYEQDLSLEALDLATAADTHVRAIIRYHKMYPQLACLVRIENLSDSEHLAGSERTLSRPVIGTLDAVLARGRAEGALREGISGVELHIAVTALGNYRITNQKTVRTLLDFDIRALERLEHDLDHYCSMILNWLRA